MSDDTSNQLRTVSLSQDDVLSLLAGIHGRQFLYVPVFPGLPEGYRVLSVHHNWHARTFVYTIEHPSFEPVPPGHQIPPLSPDGLLHAEIVQLPRIEADACTTLENP